MHPAKNDLVGLPVAATILRRPHHAKANDSGRRGSARGRRPARRTDRTSSRRQSTCTAHRRRGRQGRRGRLRLRLPAGPDGRHEGRLDGGPEAGRDQGTDQPVRPRAGVSRRHVHRHRQPQRRHPLLPRLARPGEGADRPERPGDGEALLPDADHGRLDERVRQPRHADHRRRQGDLRHRRAGMDGRSCPRASRNSSPRRTRSGSSVARRPTARTITRRSAPSRTSTS